MFELQKKKNSHIDFTMGDVLDKKTRILILPWETFWIKNSHIDFTMGEVLDDGG